jgi:enoyl-CoA hydratase/carnithine racemase
MPIPRVTLDSYATKYETVNIERRNGILQMTMHTNNRKVVWNTVAHEEMSDALRMAGLDSDNQVIIITGTGEAFIDEMDWDEISGGADRIAPGAHTGIEVIHFMMNHLNIEVPMIAAVNGPALIHADLALLCDVVLAADTAEFQDLPHFPSGLVPGDGVHILWPMLLGPSRGRYFLLTGQKLTAQQALSLGIVHELMPRQQLLARAWALAEEITTKPSAIVRYARWLLTQPLKRAMVNDLALGAGLETLGAIQYWPRSKPNV